MNIRSPLLFAALVGLFSIARADFIDPFNGTALDTSRWTPTAQFSDSSVAVSGGNVVLTNRGSVLTNEGFSGLVDVVMAFQFTGTPYDSFKIVLRTNGVVTDPSGQFDSGVFVSFRMRADTGDTANNVEIVSGSHPITTLRGQGTFAMVENQTYLIRVLDTGSLVSLFINDMDNPFLTGTTTESYGNQIGFSNREGAAAGSGISAGSQVSVDFFSVTHVPETGVTALLMGMALFGLAGMRRRTTA